MITLSDTVEILQAGTVMDHGTPVADWSNPTVAATLPAYVGYSSVSLNIAPGEYSLGERLRAVIEPYDYDPTTMRIRWRGATYTNDGPPMLRMRDGKPHHLTINLLAYN